MFPILALFRMGLSPMRTPKSLTGRMVQVRALCPWCPHCEHRLGPSPAAAPMRRRTGRSCCGEEGLPQGEGERLGECGTWGGDWAARNQRCRVATQENGGQCNRRINGAIARARRGGGEAKGGPTKRKILYQEFYIFLYFISYPSTSHLLLYIWKDSHVRERGERHKKKSHHLVILLLFFLVVGDNLDN